MANFVQLLISEIVWLCIHAKQPVFHSQLNCQTQQQSSKQETSSTVSKKSCQLDLKMLEEMN